MKFFSNSKSHPVLERASGGDISTKSRQLSATTRSRIQQLEAVFEQRSNHLHGNHLNNGDSKNDALVRIHKLEEVFQRNSAIFEGSVQTSADLPGGTSRDPSCARVLSTVYFSPQLKQRKSLAPSTYLHQRLALSPRPVARVLPFRNLSYPTNQQQSLTHHNPAQISDHSGIGTQPVVYYSAAGLNVTPTTTNTSGKQTPPSDGTHKTSAASLVCNEVHEDLVPPCASLTPVSAIRSPYFTHSLRHPFSAGVPRVASEPRQRNADITRREPPQSGSAVNVTITADVCPGDVIINTHACLRDGRDKTAVSAVCDAFKTSAVWHREPRSSITTPPTGNTGRPTAADDQVGVSIHATGQAADATLEQLPCTCDRNHGNTLGNTAPNTDPIKPADSDRETKRNIAKVNSLYNGITREVRSQSVADSTYAGSERNVENVCVNGWPVGIGCRVAVRDSGASCCRPAEAAAYSPSVRPVTCQHRTPGRDISLGSPDLHLPLVISNPDRALCLDSSEDSLSYIYGGGDVQDGVGEVAGCVNQSGSRALAPVDPCITCTSPQIPRVPPSDRHNSMIAQPAATTTTKFTASDYISARRGSVYLTDQRSGPVYLTDTCNHTPTGTPRITREVSQPDKPHEILREEIKGGREIRRSTSVDEEVLSGDTRPRPPGGALRRQVSLGVVFPPDYQRNKPPPLPPPRKPGLVPVVSSSSFERNPRPAITRRASACALGSVDRSITTEHSQAHTTRLTRSSSLQDTQSFPIAKVCEDVVSPECSGNGCDSFDNNSASLSSCENISVVSSRITSIPDDSVSDSDGSAFGDKDKNSNYASRFSRKDVTRRALRHPQVGTRTASDAKSRATKKGVRAIHSCSDIGLTSLPAFDHGYITKYLENCDYEFLRHDTKMEPPDSPNVDVSPKSRLGKSLSGLPPRPRDNSFAGPRSNSDLTSVKRTLAPNPSSECDPSLLESLLSPNKVKFSAERNGSCQSVDEKVGFMEKMRRFRRSLSREREPSPSPSRTRTDSENTRADKDKETALSRIQAQAQKAQNLLKSVEGKVKRFRSLSPGQRECPTPPLAIFSSDEDISSVPNTPEHRGQDGHPLKGQIANTNSCQGHASSKSVNQGHGKSPSKGKNGRPPRPVVLKAAQESDKKSSLFSFGASLRQRSTSPRRQKSTAATTQVVAKGKSKNGTVAQAGHAVEDIDTEVVSTRPVALTSSSSSSTISTNSPSPSKTPCTKPPSGKSKRKPHAIDIRKASPEITIITPKQYSSESSTDTVDYEGASLAQNQTSTTLCQETQSVVMRKSQSDFRQIKPDLGNLEMDQGKTEASTRDLIVSKRKPEQIPVNQKDLDCDLSEKSDTTSISEGHEMRTVPRGQRGGRPFSCDLSKLKAIEKEAAKVVIRRQSSSISTTSTFPDCPASTSAAFPDSNASEIGSVPDASVVLARSRRTQTFTDNSVPVMSPKKDRPRSECLGVRWVDAYDTTGVKVNQKHLRRSASRERPKSDTGSHMVIGEALREHQRRQSMPHPIKERHRRSPPSKRYKGRRKIWRSNSAPDISIARVSGSGISWKKLQSLHISSVAAGDLAVQPGYCDDDDASETVSIGAESQSSSECGNKATTKEEVFDEEGTFAEALWDHVTMDPEELGFRAGQDVEVLDMGDPDWWYGRIDTEEGWFPAIFVRLRAIQTDTTEEVAGKIRDGKLDKEEARQRYSCNNLLSRDEARSNVVKEIIHAETDYVKHLRDVVEGYISEAKMRKNMFPEARLKTLFGNIEEIYELSQKFLKDLLLGFNESDPKQSLLGSCFIKHKKSFVVYSEYCNNHPSSDEELRLLKRDTRYVLFFEGCQLLQDMSPIPLDGFLLTPIQKICKYPLQLRELLKHTRPEHPDYCQVEAALASMQEMALLINERKRKIESLETLTVWQSGISHWTGPDLTESSSELIHSGEMVKINHRGSQQERVFFLFDNQLIYCKKDSLRRDELLYRGRINMRDCTLYTLEDGKDSKLGVTLKNAFRIDVPGVEKPYIIYCRDKTQLERWFEAFSKEQALVTKDRESGFNLVEFRTKMEPLLQNRLKKYEKHKGRKHGNKAINTAIADSRRRGHSGLPRRPVVTTTLPRSHHNSSNQSEKKGRFFWSKKS